MGKIKREQKGAERRSAPGPERGPAVSAEDRRKLATCCAYFEAARHREVDAAHLRASDVEIAQEKISATIEQVLAPPPRRPRKKK